MTREEAINIIRDTYYPETELKALEVLIPELAESEDERIRKELIDILKKSYEFGGFTLNNKKDLDRYLAYLEKPQEQKPEKLDCKAMNLTVDKSYEKGYRDGKMDAQKPVEWSEDIIRKAVKEVGLTQHQIDWFKTNVFPPKQGWSEEDENMLNSCISSIEEAKENRYYYRETDGDTSYDHEISWLKSLRPQSHWTPSEEHLSALLAIINDPNNIWSQTCQLALSDLHEQLKWLKKIEDNANKDNA